MNRGAIVLCGGRSSRMGTDKALLPFGSETMLEQVVRIVGSVVDPQQVVVVAAENQQLPTLPSAIRIVRDSVEFQGPLAAVGSGCAALPNVDVAFITGCDAPLLSPNLIEHLFANLDAAAAVVPQDADRIYPLCAVYRTGVLSAIKRQLTTDDLSLHRLISQLGAKYISVESLRIADSQLDSLRNINSHADYVAALAVAGFSTP